MLLPCRTHVGLGLVYRGNLHRMYGTHDSKGRT